MIHYPLHYTQHLHHQSKVCTPVIAMSFRRIFIKIGRRSHSVIERRLNYKFSRCFHWHTRQQSCNENGH